ncbi:tRNA (guanine-N(7)-)-methyltransferase non-catalytic subunit wuho [Chrysoperla carnea]|uniref:tRNA (guanine-N(7)-)-methyltransferase non-catalytic subunit wuho n=1 Tax=Chrysoperla carnea TaxID=189513 RepID=UPI001D073EDB|nr:tRNA (guanine-N(7)-)-methyltransferase non-catalytic subunit wuho [Chrysoperla carnea]
MFLSSDEEDLIIGSSTKLLKINVNTKSISSINISENIDKIEVKNPLPLKINCLDFKDKHLAVCTNTKNLLLYDPQLKLLNKWLTNRSPSQLCFVNTIEIILADKTGDVYVYKRNEPKPILLLGHLSMILDVKLSLCGKYVLTGDRDEKIRVSCFPNAYNIKSYCLGHEEFVTIIKVLDSKTILTASGDGTIRFWNFIDGEEIYQINCNNHITDKKKIDSFSSEMRLVNVNTNSLPITNISIRIVNECEMHIAVTLHESNDLLIFNVKRNDSNFQSNKLQTLIIPNTKMLYFFKDKLIVFINCKISIYSFDTKTNCYNEIQSNLSNLIQDNIEFENNCDDKDDNITLLFKKSFDNLQDYQERKKLRIDDTNR